MVTASGNTAALTERATESGVDLSLRDRSAGNRATQARVAVLVVSYNGLADLCECLESLVTAHGDDDSVHIIVYDNASTDGSPDVVEQQFPQITVLRSVKNLGYAGGGSVGWRWIQQNCPNAEYVAVLNQDIIVEPNWLDILVEYLDQNPDVGLAQPMICLGPERHLINNLGLRCHYLGFAYQLNYRDRADSIPPTPREVDAVSGAAFIVRATFLSKHGLFSDDLFMYLEDVELSWRVHMSGLRCVCAPLSIVFHKYLPDALYTRYRLLERNRYVLVFTYYPSSALVTLSPSLVAMAFAQSCWSAKRGLLCQQLGIWHDLFSIGRLAGLMSRRRQAATTLLQLRLDFLCRFSGCIDLGLWPHSRLEQVGLRLFEKAWRLARWALCSGQPAHSCLSACCTRRLSR